MKKFMLGFSQGFLLGWKLSKICKCRPRKQYRFLLTQVFFNNQTIKGGNIMTVTFNDTDAKGKSLVAVFGSPVDGAGNAANVQDGSVKFASSNEEVATVEAAPDSGPYACKVSYTGKNGSADVSISADADLGDGDKEITGLFTSVIETTEATGFGDPSVGDLS